MQIAVETYGGIAFAYGINCKSPPRAGREVLKCLLLARRGVRSSARAAVWGFALFNSRK
jgi:hypothetical protein